MAWQFSENPLGQLYAGCGDGHGARTKLGFRSGAFSDLERPLEETVEHGTRRALFVRRAVGLAHLAEDLGFAQKHRVQPSGNAKKMPDRVAIVMMVKGVGQNVRADGMKFAQKRGEPGKAVVGSLRGNSVDFAAITGREHQRLFKDAPGT